MMAEERPSAAPTIDQTAPQTTAAPDDLDRDIAAAWSALPFVGALLLIVQRYIAPFLPHENPGNPEALFLKQLVRFCQPERYEHIRYLLAIICAPLAFAAAFVALRRLQERTLLFVALLGQGVLVLAFLYARRMEQHTYFNPALLLAAEAATLAICVFVAASRDEAGNKIARAVRWLDGSPAVVIACLVTAAFLTPSIIRDRELYLGSIVVWEHMEYTAGEFFGVASGKTPTVNFFPQYNNLLPVLTSPLFAVTGFTITAFTSCMFALSLLGLLAVYCTLALLTRSSAKALLLYLPLLGISFWYDGPPAWGMSIFTYYAVWPMRFVWPLVTLAVATWALRFSRAATWIVVGFVAAAGAINNVDFGVPALAAAGAAVVLSRSDRPVQSLVQFLCGVVLAVLTVFVAFRLRGNGWPDFSHAATFAKIFALHGFGMIPLPRAGFYWTILLVYLACLFVAVVSWWRAVPRSVYAGVAGFIGIFGCGSFMYYVGRSVPGGIGGYWLSWGLGIVVLLYGCWQDFQRSWRSRAWFLSVVPGVLLLTHYSLFAVLLGRNSEPITAQRERFAVNDVQGAQQREEVKAFIRRNVSKSARTMLILPMGHKIAADEGLRNHFPFPHPGSIILKAQVEQVEQVISEKRIKKVFISQIFEREEFLAMFEKLQFEKKESFGGVNFWRARSHAAPPPQ